MVPSDRSSLVARMPARNASPFVFLTNNGQRRLDRTGIDTVAAAPGGGGSDCDAVQQQEQQYIQQQHQQQQQQQHQPDRNHHQDGVKAHLSEDMTQTDHDHGRDRCRHEKLNGIQDHCMHGQESTSMSTTPMQISTNLPQRSGQKQNLSQSALQQNDADRSALAMTTSSLSALALSPSSVSSASTKADYKINQCVQKSQIKRSKRTLHTRETPTVRTVTEATATASIHAPPSNEFLLGTAFFTFMAFSLCQLFFAFVADSDAMKGDSAAMIIDSVTYLFNWVAERRKHYLHTTAWQESFVNRYACAHDWHEQGRLSSYQLRQIRKRHQRKFVLQMEILPPIISVASLLGMTVVVLHKAVIILLLDTRDQRPRQDQGTPNLILMTTFSSFNLALDCLNVFCFAKAQHLLGYQTVQEHHDDDDNDAGSEHGHHHNPDPSHQLHHHPRHQGPIPVTKTSSSQTTKPATRARSVVGDGPNYRILHVADGSRHHHPDEHINDHIKPPELELGLYRSNQSQQQQPPPPPRKMQLQQQPQRLDNEVNASIGGLSISDGLPIHGVDYGKNILSFNDAPDDDKQLPSTGNGLQQKNNTDNGITANEPSIEHRLDRHQGLRCGASENNNELDDYDDDESMDEDEQEDEKANLNMCSAYTHVFADTLRSIAVIVASAIALSDTSISSEVADAGAAVVVSALIVLSLIPLFRGLLASAAELRAIQDEEYTEHILFSSSSSSSSSVLSNSSLVSSSALTDSSQEKRTQNPFISLEP